MKSLNPKKNLLNVKDQEIVVTNVLIPGIDVVLGIEEEIMKEIIEDVTIDTKSIFLKEDKEEEGGGLVVQVAVQVVVLALVQVVVLG
jgi:hypothetical protein